MAHAVSNHLIMQESWGGLFGRAGMESGSFSQFDSAVPLADNGQRTFECIIADTNCASQGEVDAVGCLQNKTTEELLQAQAAVDNTNGPSTSVNTSIHLRVLGRRRK